MAGVTRHRVRRTGYAGRRTARIRHGRTMGLLARAGLAARGVMYVIIGWLALEIAFGHQQNQADRSGAVRVVASTPLGSVLLWLLFAGFVGMALWRLSEAAYGAAGPGGRKASTRLAALARAIFYGFVAYGILKFALGVGGPASSNQQSQDLTATAMKLPAGRLIVVVIGLGFMGWGAAFAYNALRKKFRRKLDAGQMRPATRRAVERLGQVGGIARGVVFATVGVFLVVAAARFQPREAKGLDATLRTFATTPLGPWLLVAVAAGLVIFGVYSFCESRWRRV
jgi:Domain of Unknown Function (DUF1206)